MVQGLFIDNQGRIFFHTIHKRLPTYEISRLEHKEMMPSPTFDLDQMIPVTLERYEYKGDAGPYAVYSQIGR